MSKIVLGQPQGPHWTERLTQHLLREQEQREAETARQVQIAANYLMQLPQEQRTAAFTAMNPGLQKSLGAFGFNAQLPKTQEQQYEDRLFQQRQAALTGAAPARQPAVGPMSFADAHTAAGAGVNLAALDPYEQLEARNLRNSLVTGRAPSAPELGLMGAYHLQGGVDGARRASEMATGARPTGYQQGQLNEAGRHNRETESQGAQRTQAYVGSAGAQATASRALAGLRSEETITERQLRDPQSPAVAAQVAIGQGRRAPVVTPPRFIDDTTEFKNYQTALTKLSDAERSVIQQLQGSREMLRRFPANREEGHKAQRLEGQLQAIRTQLQTVMGKRDSLATRLRKGGFIMKDEHQAMAPQQDDATGPLSTNPGSASPLSDDMRAVIRALDPSISDQEIDAILNEGGSE
jgi:hypothetical protein